MFGAVSVDPAYGATPSNKNAHSGAEQSRGPQVGERRRTPRTSLVVVLSGHQAISPDRLLEHLPTTDTGVDIIVACAGQPANLNALQRTVHEAQFLLAPAGTSAEDLRELAMKQAPGDIVTLLSGCLMPDVGMGEREILKTS